jgi:transcriptional regulator with XRE-family HTH domain
MENISFVGHALRVPIGTRIAEARRDRGISVDELCSKLQRKKIGIYPGNLSRIEREEEAQRGLAFATVDAIAEVLNLSLTELVNYKARRNQYMSSIFVVRINPRKENYEENNNLKEALSQNKIMIGWSEVRGLTDLTLSWEAFRDLVKNAYEDLRQDRDYRRTGVAAGNLWRFLREMDDAHVITPCDSDDVCIGKVTGPAYFDESKVQQDTAHCRPVKWLKRISRTHLSTALRDKLSSQLTCFRVEGLNSEVMALLK